MTYISFDYEDDWQVEQCNSALMASFSYGDVPMVCIKVRNHEGEHEDEYGMTWSKEKE